tara:strand:+ start:1036 stop:2187 length:1152 start_codon:yes stop_codon:yes gene_type:complete
MPKSKKRYIQISEPSTGAEEIDAVLEPIKTGWLTQGPKVKLFEKTFARVQSVKHALATTSCTSALHLALVSLGIGRGDEVIVPAFTWVATANVVMYTGAKPVFVDVDEETYNLDIEKLDQAISHNTKAIIPVHLFGLCADIDSIKKVLPKSIYIIEDAACAVGSTYKDKPAGSLGDFGCFSFHPRKTITTGEGGMLTTNDDQLSIDANILRNHGASLSEEIRHESSKPYLLPEFNVLGFNYRMTDIQGAIGLAQLKKLEQLLSERAKWANWYNQNLNDISWLNLPKVPKYSDHSWQAYVVVVNESSSPASRNKIMEYLMEEGISTRPGTHAVTNLKYYKSTFNIKADQFCIANKLENSTLALPLHNRMTEEDFLYISDVLHRI